VWTEDQHYKKIVFADDLVELHIKGISNNMLQNNYLTSINVENTEGAITNRQTISYKQLQQHNISNKFQSLNQKQIIYA
jgi:hypothetical protein